MTDANRASDVHVLSLVEAHVRAGQLNVYRSLVGTPYVACDVPQLPTGHMVLWESDFRGWLSLYGWEVGGIVLAERQITRVLQVLSGMSLRKRTTHSTDRELLKSIEAEPVIAAVLEYMHAQSQPRIEDTMKVFWKNLRKFAQERGLLIRGNNRFPGGANVLSRKLREHAPVLYELGIKVTIWRSNGSNARLERLDDLKEEPSLESSAHKSSCEHEIGHKNRREKILADLQAKQLHPNEPCEEGLFSE